MHRRPNANERLRRDTSLLRADPALLARFRRTLAPTVGAACTTPRRRLRFEADFCRQIRGEGVLALEGPSLAGSLLSDVSIETTHAQLPGCSSSDARISA